MTNKIRFLPSDVSFDAKSGMSVLEAAVEAGLYIDAPCGGNGICENCKVQLVTPDGETEGLACQTLVEDGMVIRLAPAEDHRILETGIETEFSVSSALTRDANGDVFFGKTSLGTLEKSKALCAMAFDIGTTTVVGYLLNVESGETLSTVSCLNPQSKFGADVIARANYAINNGGDSLADTIREALSSLIGDAAKEAGIDRKQIFLVTVVGNTCMHHLFLGIPTNSLVVAPYKPVTVDAQQLKALEYGVKANENAVLLVLPNISGFVGADTVGGILSSNIDREEPMTLLVDIGTNGEMVLGNKKRLCACSTAAGPAFEGALISVGMRGARGAIDHADFSDGTVKVSVIGNAEAIGVCGSGLIDIIAQLVINGLVEESGRLVTKDELTDEKAKKLAENIGEKDGLKVFWLTKNVCITQKDIREVQLAKAAIASGIDLLMKRLGVTTAGVDRVMLAGAFGNYMSPESACAIGLLPKELESRIIPVGNAAGQGSKMAALSKSEYLRSIDIGRTTEYMELAGLPEFNDVFMDNIEF